MTLGAAFLLCVCVRVVKRERVPVEELFLLFPELIGSVRVYLITLPYLYLID